MKKGKSLAGFIASRPRIAVFLPNRARNCGPSNAPTAPPSFPSSLSVNSPVREYPPYPTPPITPLFINAFACCSVTSIPTLSPAFISIFMAVSCGSVFINCKALPKYSIGFPIAISPAPPTLLVRLRGCLIGTSFKAPFKNSFNGFPIGKSDASLVRAISRLAANGFNLALFSAIFCVTSAKPFSNLAFTGACLIDNLRLLMELSPTLDNALVISSCSLASCRVSLIKTFSAPFNVARPVPVANLNAAPIGIKFVGSAGNDPPLAAFISGMTC